MRTWLRQLAAACVVSLISGCASTSGEPSALSKIADFTLGAMGLQTDKPIAPEIPESQKPSHKISLRLHAGGNLNAGASGPALSAVTRIYKLKQTAAFYSASYDSFLSPEKEKAALGVDLVEVREVNLVPGQIYEVTETVSREAQYIGVVTLFMSPATRRWRAAFAAPDAETSGITLGIHACSMTVGKGAQPDQPLQAEISNAPALCR